MEKTIQALADLEQEAARFANVLAPAAHGATFITLSGELGAGKTAFTKAVARAFGVEEVVNSPTFVLEKIYPLPHGNAFQKLIHIDAYRFEPGDTLAPLGLDELMHDAGNLIMLEWPERVSGQLPVPMIRISFIAHPNGSRTITYG